MSQYYNRPARTERMAPYFDIQSHVLPGQYIREYPAATADSQEDTLRLHVNQYTPANRQSCPAGAVTVIAAHANGFPKVRNVTSTLLFQS